MVVKVEMGSGWKNTTKVLKNEPIAHLAISSVVVSNGEKLDISLSNLPNWWNENSIYRAIVNTFPDHTKVTLVGDYRVLETLTIDKEFEHGKQGTDLYFSIKHIPKEKI